MTNVTKISFRIQTGNHGWSGTDTEIDMEIYRDSTLLVKLILEPGRTARLTRNENATYYWVFLNNSGVTVSISGFTPPYYEEFPYGVEGHLKVKFIARGDDAWEKVLIVSTVFSGDIKGVPGTIDSMYWEEYRKDYAFTRDVVLSTDSNEGNRTWQLNY